MDPEQQTQTDIQQVPNSHEGKKSLLLAGVIVTIIGLNLFIFLFAYQQKRTKQQISTSKQEQLQRQNIPSLANVRQWVNCNDVRDIIEEEDSLYVACLGGVLITNKEGRVIDQITMTQGLSNPVTNSLLKNGNQLYIGTQDGFTIFNLSTREAKKVSVSEGLISGSNIKLEEDSNNIWVGSFEGLSRYEISTGKIQNYTTELADNSTKYNASNILITPNAIYAIVLANAHTPGGVARLDKITQQWERFGPDAFGITGQYARIDLFNITQVGNKIYVAENNGFWEAEDKLETTWNKMDSVMSQVSRGQNGNFITRMSGVESSLYILVNNLLYVYNPTSQQIKRVYPLHDEGENILSNTSSSLFSAISTDKKLWMFGNESWLKWLNLDSLKTDAIVLQKRPVNLEQIVVTIDEDPIVIADGKFFLYDSRRNEFKKLSGLKEYTGLATFQPIPDTSKIFLFSQPCGQGCGEPKIALYDFIEGSIKPLDISNTILSKLKAGSFGSSTNYYSLEYKKYDYYKDEFIFNMHNSTGQEQVVLKDKTYEWIQGPNEQKLDQSSDKPIASISCGQKYTFASNGNKFIKPYCLQKLETLPYAIYVKNDFPKNSIWIIDKKTDEKTQLLPPLSLKEYSPFGQKDVFTVKNVVYENGKLWINSNRGLSSYDLINKTWKLFTTKEGLISNDVDSFVVGENSLWVLTHWGGFSGIPL